MDGRVTPRVKPGDGHDGGGRFINGYRDRSQKIDIFLTNGWRVVLFFGNERSGRLAPPKWGAAALAGMGPRDVETAQNDLANERPDFLETEKTETSRFMRRLARSESDSLLQLSV